MVFYIDYISIKLIKYSDFLELSPIYHVYKNKIHYQHCSSEDTSSQRVSISPRITQQIVTRAGSGARLSGHTVSPADSLSDPWRGSECVVVPDRCHHLFHIKSHRKRASLFPPRERILLPMQETQVRSLVWEHPAWPRTIKPVRHNYWACALEPGNLQKPKHSKACAPQREKPLQRETRVPQGRLALACRNRRKARAATKTRHSQIHN